jgi:CPA1 family monovalent cation:H+ antiporter
MLDFEKIIVLMSAAVLLVSFAKRVNIPYPIALVLGGGLLSFIPGLDFTSFDPNVIMTVVLPPILYYASFWTSHNDFKKHFREISSLAIGLVIATTACVTLFFKWLFPDYSWALAFAFGAIVSPPDAAAATSILRRFPIGPKLITILEGESLVNDASALVLYRIATTAIVTGTFSLMSASLDFVFMGAGGVALGIFLGYALQTLIKRYFDPVIAAFSSFLIPYIVYVLANLMDVSGVLAVVAFGIVSSRIIFKQQSPLRRVFGRVTWDLIIILLNRLPI